MMKLSAGARLGGRTCARLVGAEAGTVAREVSNVIRVQRAREGSWPLGDCCLVITFVYVGDDDDVWLQEECTSSRFLEVGSKWQARDAIARPITRRG